MFRLWLAGFGWTPYINPPPSPLPFVPECHTHTPTPTHTPCSSSQSSSHRLLCTDSISSITLVSTITSCRSSSRPSLAKVSLSPAFIFVSFLGLVANSAVSSYYFGGRIL